MPTHALHFSFGIGALMAPQLARPFLPPSGMCGESSDLHNGTILYNSSAQMVWNKTSMCVMGEDTIEHPYLMIAIATCAVGLVFFGLQVSKSQHYTKDMADTKRPTKSLLAGKPVKEKLQILLLIFLLCIFWGLPIGAERAYGKFLYAFSLESDLRFSVDAGTSLVLLFWASFTAGRGLATLFSKWLAPWQLLLIELGISTVSMLTLSVVGHQHHIVLWICSATFGASLSPIFPGCITWANNHITMTPMMTALAFISASVGAMAFSWMAGYLFEYHGPMTLMYLLLGYALTAFIFYFGIALSLRRMANTSIQEDEPLPLQEKTPHIT